MTDKNKLQRWSGPEPVELAPLRNSISSELSYDGITYTPLERQDVQDIISEGRELRVQGLALTDKQRMTILDSVQFAFEQGAISGMDADSVRRTILEGR